MVAGRTYKVLTELESSSSLKTKKIGELCVYHQCASSDLSTINIKYEDKSIFVCVCKPHTCPVSATHSSYHMKAENPSFLLARHVY